MTLELPDWLSFVPDTERVLGVPPRSRLLIERAQYLRFQISSAPIVFRALRRVKSLRTDVTPPEILSG